ncbi:tRNA lysidine(34) synthetase TilS [Actinocatenispora rupis]|uniref:tRNA(Ile)-lysidine synthase n=1 Tax=Actinocatenispora rupis TaxID=519421 RepID=A0A8J3NFB5_9ACTN|nr:tRNA lysidine(34) synthetase TilS [Actinocatenispora rupis]GID15082.1 tRNA(Ile)-lysidine synthase [Actinocatenispora rupis]
MARVPGATAAVRRAVRRVVADADGTVLVACSGGADSLALAAATAFVAPRAGLRAGLVTVDHGLQEGSAARAAGVAGWARAAGLAPVEVATVAVGRAGGPEAAARSARYAALDDAADRLDAVVLLGHTRDDQAETVLLALARGAGPRGLAGMAAARGRYRRPLLDLPRATTAASCAELGLIPWEDPHNTDPAYARSRLRSAMDELESLLGKGFRTNLARTAGLVAADCALLDEQAATLLSTVDTGTGLDVAALAAAPAALRTRVLRAFALRLGAPGSALTAAHVASLDALLTDWHGQGPVYLPGAITVHRRAGLLSP